MSIPWANIAWPDQQYNPGGTLETIYYAPMSAFDTPLALPASPSSLGASVTIATAPTFASGAHWYTIYVTQDMNELVDKLVGENDGKSWTSDLEIHTPGTQAAALGWCAQFANTSGVFLIPQADGTVRALGVEFSAKVDSAEIKTGKKSADKKGIMIKIGTRGRTPAPIYTGVIALS